MKMTAPPLTPARRIAASAVCAVIGGLIASSGAVAQSAAPFPAGQAPGFQAPGVQAALAQSPATSVPGAQPLRSAGMIAAPGSLASSSVVGVQSGALAARPDERNATLLTTFIGSQPILDNQIDLTTQLNVQIGPDNVANNRIRRDAVAGPDAPMIGNNITAATQYNAQAGRGNVGLNNASATQVAGAVPDTLAPLVRNDIFVGTQINAQVGSRNLADNAIRARSAVGRN